ncbi:hypothetical protein EDB84DRAFT_1476714 [Lactarius hengduanensis]|nr:hypothetical protein EDB84DRAFT_1476714 [Lactarius hengduanensis]
MAEYEFWFFVEGTDLGKMDVADLKTKIHEEGRHSYWIGVDAIELVLFQVCLLSLRALHFYSNQHSNFLLPSAIGKRKAEDETERGKPPKLVRTELLGPDTSGFSRIPSRKVQAAWDLYTNMWGQPLKDVVQTVHGQQNVLEYVPSEKFRKLGLKFLGFIERVLLFRQEYIIAFNLLGLGPPTRRENSVVVTGHSGIAFQDAAKAYVRVIQTTSPALDHSKGWYEVSANQYVMNYSSFEKMDVLGKILDLNCDVLQRIYNTWGPSTHNCVHLTRHPGQEGGLRRRCRICCARLC